MRSRWTRQKSCRLRSQPCKPETEGGCPAYSSRHIEEQKAAPRHTVGSRQQGREHSKDRDEAADKYYDAAILKKKIATDQQAVFVEVNVVPVFFQHRQTEPAPHGIPGAVTDDRARCRGDDDGDDADLIRTAGEHCGANQ